MPAPLRECVLIPVDEYESATAHLTAEQHGAYMLLVMAAWQEGGALTVNDALLAGIARMSPRSWAANREIVLALFQHTGDGRIVPTLLAGGGP